MASNSQRVAYSSFNGYAPTEGPKAIPIEFDFSSVATLEINLLNENTNGVIQYVQSVWVENQENENDLIITIHGTGQVIHVMPFSQGMWPVISGDQTVITLSGTVAPTNAGKIILLNVPMSYFNSGTLTVSGDVNATLTTESLQIYRGTYTDFSGTIAVGGTSQQAIAANTSRKQLIIQNPVTATEALWVNFGAAAGVGATASISLNAGDFFITNQYVTTQSINVNAATAGHVYVVKELV